MASISLNSIASAVAHYAPRYGISKAFLFGSYARGEQTPESDVDIVVELSRPLGFKRARLIEDLQERLGATVDVVFGENQLFEPVHDCYERDKVVLYESR